MFSECGRLLTAEEGKRLQMLDAVSRQAAIEKIVQHIRESHPNRKASRVGEPRRWYRRRVP